MSTRSNSIQARQREEQIALRKSFLENAQTPEEKILALRDVAFIEKSLELMKVQSLLGFGTKRTGKMALSHMLSTMLDQELAARYDLGLIPRKQIEITDITDVQYEWTFTHTIRLRNGSKRRNYQTRLQAGTEAQALNELHRKLKAKKRELVSIDDTRRKLVMIITEDGKVYNPYTVEIVENGEVLS